MAGAKVHQESGDPMHQSPSDLIFRSATWMTRALRRSVGISAEILQTDGDLARMRTYASEIRSRT